MLHNFSDAISQIINYIDFARNVDIHNPPKVPRRNKGKVKMAEKNVADLLFSSQVNWLKSWSGHVLHWYSSY